MRKLIFLLGGMFLPALSWGWMGMGGGVDYSRDADNMFYCANVATAPVTTQAGISISSPALSMYNPINSGKNLVLLEVGIDVTASPAAAAGFFLTYNITPSSGPSLAFGSYGVMTSAVVGKSTSTVTTRSVAVCRQQGFLPILPTAFRFLGGTTGAAAIGGVLLTDYTNGKVVVPPGGLISLQSTSAAAVAAHFLVREEPK